MEEIKTDQIASLLKNQLDELKIATIWNIGETFRSNQYALDSVIQRTLKWIRKLQFIKQYLRKENDFIKYSRI